VATATIHAAMMEPTTAMAAATTEAAISFVCQKAPSIDAFYHIPQGGSPGGDDDETLTEGTP